MKKIYLAIILIITAISLTGCGSNTDKIYGSELVMYCAIYDTDSKLAYEFPIICKNKVEDFYIDGYNITGEGIIQ